MSAGLVLPPGAGRRIVGGSLDATVKMTTDHPALTSSFEVVIAPGFDVGAHVHAIGWDRSTTRTSRGPTG